MINLSYQATRWSGTKKVVYCISHKNLGTILKGYINHVHKRVVIVSSIIIDKQTCVHEQKYLCM